ncbi:MAG TPA: RagB/SusD family nutrient uptake outer membrane protein, partial [Paludibacter sp.]
LVKAYGATSSNGLVTTDKRLAWNVAMPGSTMGIVSGVARKVDSYVGGVDAVGSKFGATTTGFYLRKSLCDNFDLAKGDNKSKSWVLMRYSEVLMNLAEAANEVYGPTTPIPGLTSGANTAQRIVYAITDRAGVLRTSIPTDQATFHTWIREQRRLEFAFEEQRFFDVRRWKIAEVTESTPLLGLKVTNIAGVYTYEEFVVDNRVFDPKMYRYPIPYNEVAKSGGAILQNEGW